MRAGVAGLVVVIVGSGAVWAEDTATVVLDAPTAKGTATLLDKELPAGVPVKLHIPASGTDPIHGSVLVWPTRSDQEGACAELPELDAKQRHELGLVATGTGDTKALEATIPPLQLATRYCVLVTFDRRLAAEVLTSIGAELAATAIDWRHTCPRADRDAYVAQLFAGSIKRELDAYHVKIPEARVQQAAGTAVRLFDLDAHCAKLIPSEQRVHDAAERQHAAAEHLSSVKHGTLCLPRATGCTRPPRTVIRSWPAAVTKVGTELKVSTLADVDASSVREVLTSLSGTVPDVEAALRAFLSAAAADKARATTELKNKLEAPPLAPQPLALYVPGLDRHVAMARLYDVTPAGEPTPSAAQALGDLAKSFASGMPVLVRQLQVMRQSDPRTADVWLNDLLALNSASQDAAETLKDVQAANAAADVVATGITTDLKQIVQTEAFKDLLRTTTSDPVKLASSKAPSTDEKGSWVSPNVGVLGAAPLIARDGKRGFTTGWLEPYAGASIYFDRVDRVIDLRDLFGDTFWQRNSLTVGFLLSKPSLNGKDINGPWSTSVVPVAGFGHRVTQYFRIDAGLIPFTYVDANPVVAGTHWGVAFWVGASLDADVWAAVSGKLGK